jgi:predicted nucleic acid-binding protein
MPVTESLLRKTAWLAPADVPLPAGDAIHTATALETGETEIWTNDRHLLAAVAHFGLAGRSA